MIAVGSITAYPAPKDGISIKGDTGLTGQTVMQVKWVPGSTYYNEQTGAFRRIDILIIFTSTGAVAGRYQCNETYTSAVDELPPSGIGNAHWTRINTLDTLYTPLLVADTGEITFLSSNQILIKKADGTINAGMSGAGTGATGYRMWSGGISGDTAFNRWAEDGSGRLANGAIEWDANGLTRNRSTPVYSWRNLPIANGVYIQNLLPYQGTYISIPAGVFSSYKIVLPSPDDNPGMKLIFMQILPPGRSIPTNPPAISCSVYGVLKVFLSPNIHPGDSAVNKITSLSAGRIYEFISIPAQTYLGIGYAWYIRDDTGMTFVYE